MWVTLSTAQVAPDSVGALTLAWLALTIYAEIPFPDRHGGLSETGGFRALGVARYGVRSVWVTIYAVGVAL